MILTREVFARSDDEVAKSYFKRFLIHDVTTYTRDRFNVLAEIHAKVQEAKDKLDCLLDIEASEEDINSARSA